MVPVKGAFATTSYRPLQEAAVPVNGPVIKIILLSGPSGSTCGSTSSQKYFVPRPRAPIKSWAACMLSGSFLMVPASRSTRINCPIHPFIVIPPIHKRLSADPQWPFYVPFQPLRHRQWRQTDKTWHILDRRHTDRI